MPHDIPRFKQPIKVKFDVVGENNVIFIQKDDESNRDHKILDIWRVYPVKAKEGYATLELTSFSKNFVSLANGIFKVEE